MASENPYRPILKTVSGSTDSTGNKADITGSGTSLSAASKQPFGFVSLVALVVASMIGSGVFTTSGFALGDLKDSRLVMAVWCVGGVVALCGAIGYGTLSARLPGSGGEYLFLSRAVHPAIGFLAGWISLIAGFTVPMALAAKTFAIYLLSGSQVSEAIIVAVAIGAIVIAAIANLISAHGGAWLQNALVIIKLLLLMVFIGLAALTPAERWYSNTLPIDQWPAAGDLVTVLLMMAGSLVWVSLSYTGFNAAIYVAGEAQRAESWVPRSMVVATSVVTVFYVVLNYVFLHAAPAEVIAYKPEVALIAAEHLQGKGLANFVRIIVCLATFTSVWSIAIAGPRVYTQMAQDGVMPKWLVGKGSEPRLAIASQAILATLVVYFASLQKMLGYLGLTLSLCAALTVACVWLPAVRRTSEPETTTSWKDRFALLAASIYVIATIGLMALGAISRLGEASAAGITVVIGLVLAVTWRYIGK